MISAPLTDSVSLPCGMADESEVVGLPPDVESSASEKEESDVELPESMLAADCCKKKCIDAVRASPFLCQCQSRLQASVDRLDLPGRNTLWFNQMQSMHSHGTRTLSWHGISLCHAAYSMVSLCPKKKISKFLKAISLGAVRAPVDGRSLNIAKPKPKRDDCNVFFSFLYENLSEPLALARDQVEDEEVAEEESYNVERIEAPQWLLEQDFLEVPIELGHVAAGSADKRLVEKRWLPTMSLAEIYDLYKDMHCDHAELSSWSSFSRAWKDWQQIIAIRPAQVHARCDDCAKYAKYRQLHCDNEADLKAVTNAYNKRIKEVFADRHVMTLLENKVEQSMKQGEQELPHLVLVIDGMDKSKWLSPKLVENTKRMSMLWRPSLHLVGVMIPGVLEFMAILEPDVKGDSDCQQTLICRAIQLAEEQLLRSGRSLPGRLVIQFDNTSKEGRNSQMLLWSSMMIKMKRFTDIAFGLMRVGHTHNRLDQRFGVISALLRRASCLETAEDYQAYILEHYKPARGLPLICEVITACHCWRDLMAPLETAFTGITGSKTTADAAHVMRVVARKDVAHCAPGCVAEEGDDFDPVLLAKHWLCSKVLSQPPTVQLEGKAKVDLSLLRTMPAPRAWLTDESLKKYAKTAEEVLQKPWQLHAAFSYFQDWLRRNGEQIPGKLPDIECIINGRDFLEPTGPEVTATWKDFAPEGALAIREVRARPKTYGPKRPPKTDAAASAAVAPQLAHLSRRQRAQQGAPPPAQPPAQPPAPEDNADEVPAQPQNEPEIEETANDQPPTKKPRTQQNVLIFGNIRSTPKMKDGKPLAWQVTCPKHPQCNRARNVAACASEDQCFCMLMTWALLADECEDKQSHKEKWGEVETKATNGELESRVDLEEACRNYEG